MKVTSIIKSCAFLFILACVLFFAGCTSTGTIKIPKDVPEIHPGLLAGYLETEALPNSFELIPPPPEDGSAAMALDAEVSRESLRMRDTQCWKMTIADANLHFP